MRPGKRCSGLTNAAAAGDESLLWLRWWWSSSSTKMMPLRMTDDDDDGGMPLLPCERSSCPLPLMVCFGSPPASSRRFNAAVLRLNCNMKRNFSLRLRYIITLFVTFIRYSVNWTIVNWRWSDRDCYSFFSRNQNFSEHFRMLWWAEQYTRAKTMNIE